MVDTPEPPLPVDLASLLGQASHALTARVGAELVDLGISARDYAVLSRAAQVERTQVEVAELTGLDKTTMVVTLDGLEKAGLAHRRVLPSDRRARVVEVTPEGLVVLEKAHVVVDHLYQEVLGSLDPATAQGFLGCLSTLTAGVLAEPHAGSTPRRRQVSAPPP
ncbi:MAG: MarR family transcriptional regulator [Actinomycetota bacterium]|nr:MarR family transcriptional regulator [Actinomycetota bacterium]